MTTLAVDLGASANTLMRADANLDGLSFDRVSCPPLEAPGRHVAAPSEATGTAMFDVEPAQ